MSIPNYSLYGVTVEERLAEPVHCESIAERSRLHAWEIKPHRHTQFFQILYMRRGCVEARLDGAQCTLADRQVLAIPSGCVHGFRFSRDVEGSVVTLSEHYLHQLLPPGLAGTSTFAQARVFTLHDAGSAAATIETGLERFAAEFGESAPLRSSALAAWLTLVLVGLSRLSVSQAQAQAPGGARALRHFIRFQALVDARYRSERDLAVYASAIGITPTQLNRVCRQVARRSALQLLNERLLVEAQRNLLYTELDVQEIAATLGFSDASYFSRFFSQHMAQTPTAFRRIARGALPGAASPGADAGAGPGR